MTTAEYLSAVLKSQALPEDGKELKALRSKRGEVEGLLKKAFEDSNPTIRYGGSYAKKTLIRESYDLDLTCYFAHDDKDAGDSLKDVFEHVAAALADKYIVQPKTSAIRLLGKTDADWRVDFHVDVVPGRFTDESAADVYIYQNGAEKERLKTNLDVHLSHIRDSGVTDAIRLLKLWKSRRMLNLKTFVLELMVVKTVGKLKSKPLADQLVAFWKAAVDASGNIAVEDPANPKGNDLSGINDVGTQALLSSWASAALASIEADRWQDIFGEVEDTSETAKAALLTAPSIVGTGRTKPWMPNGSRC